MSKYYIGDLEFYSDPSEALEHHGILGQKWGVRRYQNPDGSYTSEGLQRRYGTGEGIKSNVSRMANNIGEGIKKKLKSTFNPSDEERAARAARKEEKRALKEEERRAKFEAEKERVLKRGTAEEVLNMSHELTQSELNSAIARLQSENALRNLMDSEKNRGGGGGHKHKTFIDRLQSAEKLITSYSNIKTAFNNIKKDKEAEEEKEKKEKAHRKEKLYAQRMISQLDKKAAEENRKRNEQGNDEPWFPSFDEVTKINQQINAYHLLREAADGNFGGGGGGKKKK